MGDPNDPSDVGQRIYALNKTLSKKLDEQNALLADLVKQMKYIVSALNSRL